MSDLQVTPNQALTQSHRWELNPRPLGEEIPTSRPIPCGVALATADKMADEAPKSARTRNANDTHTTFDGGLLRTRLALPSRAIRAGWSESAVWTPEAA
jgi:hypothetical protein